MSWAVGLGWGLLCAFALRRRFRLAFLLKVCSALCDEVVGLVPALMVVRVGMVVILSVSDSQALSVLLGGLLQCIFCHFGF